jgi:hypothetical protein
MDSAKQKLIEKILESEDSYSDLAERFNIDLMELVEAEVNRVLNEMNLEQLIEEL